MLMRITENGFSCYIFAVFGISTLATTGVYGGYEYISAPTAAKLYKHPLDARGPFRTNRIPERSRRNEENIDYYVEPKYTYKYGVEDPETGDLKTAYETRDGDVVKGAYTVLDPDGNLRTVEYTSDKDSGFNVVIHNSQNRIHPSKDNYDS